MSDYSRYTLSENATAIWEYDPTLEGNCVLGGSLDVIAAIWTLSIKVSVSFMIIHHICITPSTEQASSQRIVLSGDRISHFDMVRTSASICVMAHSQPLQLLYSLPTHRGTQFILGI